MSVHLCGVTGGGVPLRAYVTRYVCPGCEGTGRADDGGRCYWCAGNALTDEVYDDPGNPPALAPRPPAVLREPCTGCAYRPGSPEDGSDALPRDARTPFFCHRGMHRVDDGEGGAHYVPAAECNGTPLGYFVCAGWWGHVVEGGPAPTGPFRGPGGSDRAGAGAGSRA